jgi:RNA polymerase sigma factor for flagellar operon FliA
MAWVRNEGGTPCAQWVFEENDMNQSERYRRFAPLVRRIAIRLGNRIPRHVSISDLVSIGWVGLLEALDRGRGQVPEDEMETFVVCRVRGAMLDYLRSVDPATRRVRSASRKLSHAVHELTRHLGRAPASEEIAEELGLSIDDYHDLCNDISAAHELSFQDGLHGSDSADPEKSAERKLVLEQAAKAIQRLPERLQQLVGLLYQEGLAQCEAAQVLGVGPARVCQLHAEALERLRVELGVVA